MENSQHQYPKRRIAEVLKLIVSELTSAQCEISVSFIEGEKTTVYRVEVPADFRGRLIGVQGRNIESLRTLVGAIGGKNGFRAIIELVV